MVVVIVVKEEVKNQMNMITIIEEITTTIKIDMVIKKDK